MPRGSLRDNCFPILLLCSLSSNNRIGYFHFSLIVISIVLFSACLRCGFIDLLTSVVHFLFSISSFGDMHESTNRIPLLDYKANWCHPCLRLFGTVTFSKLFILLCISRVPSISQSVEV